MKIVRILLKYQLPVLFVALLLLPAINGKFEFWKFERSAENRTFTDSLNLDFGKLDAFPAECEAYVNDNFPFRSPLLDLYHSIKFNCFHVSPHPDRTIVGKDGWYFMGENHLASFEGKRDFTEDTLKLFVDEFKRRKKYLDDRNIKMYWLIAPTKHNVYPKKLPFNVYPGEKRRVIQLKEAFQASLPDIIIDPVPELLRAKKNGKLYYQLDNHWNYQAGYLTSQILRTRIQKDFPNFKLKELPAFTWRDSVEHSGIHHAVLGIQELSEVRRYPIITHPRSIENQKYNFQCPAGFAAPWDFERRFTIDKDSLGLTVLIIRDSFGHQLLPFMSELFKESVFIFDAWQYKLNEAIIEKVKPDIVIFITLESYLEAVVGNYSSTKQN